MNVLTQLSEEDIRAAVERMDFRLKSVTREEFADRIVGMIKGEMTPKDVQGIDDATMERLYAIAYNTFQAGKYDQARELFQYLTVTDYTKPKYWNGLGATAFSTKNWTEALNAYGMACQTAPKDPKPRLRAADCWLALGDVENALMGLDEAASLCGDNPKFADEKAKAQGLSKILRERLVKKEEA